MELENSNNNNNNNKRILDIKFTTTHINCK